MISEAEIVKAKINDIKRLLKLKSSLIRIHGQERYL